MFHTGSPMAWSSLFMVTRSTDALIHTSSCFPDDEQRIKGIHIAQS